MRKSHRFFERIDILWLKRCKALKRKNWTCPCQCQRCGIWFDLNDGVGSKKWFPAIVISEECGNDEQKEIELDKQIEQLNSVISNAEYEIMEAKKRLLAMLVSITIKHANYDKLGH